ncbi:MAG: endonuclease MutS2 [Clostridiales Family XIII bacterium]|nr:endonuclease MutS2 [Clostridiales Family XIII bacterium]
MIREYRILEYDKVLEMLQDRTASARAAALAHALAPADRIEEVGRRQAETAEAVSVCLRKGTPPFAETEDVTASATLASKGGLLSMRQLLSIAAGIAVARQVRAFLLSDMPEDAAPRRTVRRLAEGLSALPALEKRIRDAILGDTEMADGASPALRRLRHAIEAQHGKIRERLAKFVSAPSSALQDRVITIRGGRFVLPVKQEQASQFPGIVHDRSKGGATLFIEPQAVVELNNKLRELELEEAAEVERILAELSAEAGACAGEITENQRLLAELDFIFAKANLALDMKAFQPEIRPFGGEIEIEQGRNPLIGQDRVVPVSVRFGGGGAGTLIITGPNTGGKTVTLKTVGLFLLMAQAGLFTPASRAALPLCRRVFADIGDEQSIEQNLSTFSAHMKNIVEVVAEAGPHDVALLDELGAGTDPAEGAALAVALLETLRARGCPVLATTHYTELKKYAVAADGVENASMEFDAETLAPTFRLIMGSPGRSNAFEISARLGLPEGVIARARGLLDTEAIVFDDVVTGLERDRKAAAEARAEAERQMRAAQEEAKRASAAAREAEQKQRALLEKAQERADEVLREAERDAEEAAAELKALLKEASGLRAGAPGPDGGDLKRRAGETRKKLQKKRRAGAQRAPAPAKTKATGETIGVGDAVTVAGTGLTGEVLSIEPDRGRVTVLAGSVKMTLEASSLEKLAGAPAKKRPQQGSRYAKIVVSKMDTIGPSIDLHGKNLDEAEMLVDKYLDDAVLARMHEVAINHGRGSGVLREGLRRFLKRHGHVKSFRPGRFDEGGDGVTIVTLVEN